MPVQHVLTYIIGSNVVLADSIVVIVLGMIGRSLITGSFDIAWIYTSEMYPTSIRNMGLTIASTGARAASASAPFILLLVSRIVIQICCELLWCT